MELMSRNKIIDVGGIEDLDSFYEIEKQCFTIEVYSKRVLRSLLTSPSTICLKASVQGQIVGFIIGDVRRSNRPCQGEVVTIDVTPKFRRMGIATLLLKRLEKEFQNRGCSGIRLHVRVDNKTAINLFRKLGYQEKKKVTNYYADAIDAFLMEKASRAWRS